MRGFTLIEVVVTVAICAAMLAALADSFLSFEKLYSYQEAYSSAANATGAVMSALESTVLPAEAVLASHTFTQGTYSSATSTLVLELPSITSAGAIIASDYDYAAFYASGTAAYELVAANAASARASGTIELSGAVNTLSFSYDNATPAAATDVTALVAASSTSQGKTASSTLSEVLWLRNT